MYPNLASKIRIRIRRADPKRDYRYDESFDDTAIVVSLSWIDGKKTCEYLSCNSTFAAKKGTCRPGDDPRIFPSG